MSTYLNENEQAQLVKDWLKKYGISIVLGVCIAIIASFGWRYWQQHKVAMSLKASDLYGQMMVAKSQNQTDQYQQLGQKLIKEFKNTPYAGMAGLMLAQDAVNQDKLADAEQQYAWVAKHATDKNLRHLAVIRQARVLMAENKPEAALKVLDTLPEKILGPAVMVTKGDILVALGKNEAARRAYGIALQVLPNTAMIKPFVQMKYDALATAEKAPTESTSKNNE